MNHKKQQMNFLYTLFLNQQESLLCYNAILLTIYIFPLHLSFFQFFVYFYTITANVVKLFSFQHEWDIKSGHMCLCGWISGNSVYLDRDWKHKYLLVVPALHSRAVFFSFFRGLRDSCSSSCLLLSVNMSTLCNSGADLAVAFSHCGFA